AQLDVELALHLEDDVDQARRVDFQVLQDLRLGPDLGQRLLIAGERLDDLDYPRERLGHVYLQRSRITHALTSLKPKLALARTSSGSGSSVRRAMRSANGARRGCRSSQFAEPWMKPRASSSAQATSSMPPAAPSPWPMSDLVALS